VTTNRASDDLDVEGRERVEMLLQYCRERGLPVSVMRTVDAATCAELCGRSLQTLANWRTLGRGPIYRRRVGRIEYALADVADFLLTPDE
jgi:hypothetical protein